MLKVGHGLINPFIVQTVAGLDPAFCCIATHEQGLFPCLGLAEFGLQSGNIVSELLPLFFNICGVLFQPVDHLLQG